VNGPVQKLEELPIFDVAVLAHGFTPDGRDYLVITETNWERGLAGQYEYRFSHVVVQRCETRVRDEVWQRSWDDVFTDYAAWERAGSPDGYVWGTCWSLAYPGQTVSASSPLASEWTRRVGHAMVELHVETDGFLLTLVFHDVQIRKLNGERGLIDRATIRLS
jgi:hypothetical protein